MRGFTITGIAAWLALAAPALAQSAITLTADPVPIVDAQINGQPVRLEVDLRLPDMLALNSAAAGRLRVWRIPLAVGQVGIEGSDTMLRARIARPRLVFGNETSRVFAGVFGVPVTNRADGVIGPGALPHDVITIVLGPEQPGSREIAFALADADVWKTSARIGGEEIRVEFDVSGHASVFNRSAARAFDAAGAIPAAGELAETPLILGLSTLMQPVRTPLTVEGLSLGRALARTNAPLLGAIEDDAIVIAAESSNAPTPSLTLGREALSACSSIRVDRRARRLTLTCAG